MPRPAIRWSCGCSCTIGPRRSIRRAGLITWLSVCSEDGPGETELAAAEALAERGVVAEAPPPPPPTRASACIDCSAELPAGSRAERCSPCVVDAALRAKVAVRALPAPPPLPPAPARVTPRVARRGPSPVPRPPRPPRPPPKPPRARLTCCKKCGGPLISDPAKRRRTGQLCGTCFDAKVRAGVLAWRRKAETRADA